MQDYRPSQSSERTLGFKVCSVLHQRVVLFKGTFQAAGVMVFTARGCRTKCCRLVDFFPHLLILIYCRTDSPPRPHPQYIALYPSLLCIASLSSYTFDTQLQPKLSIFYRWSTEGVGASFRSSSFLIYLPVATVITDRRF